MKQLLVTFLLVTLVKTTGFSQKISFLKGIVNSFNQPVSNVNIYNKNAKLGEVTNENGKFEILVRLNDTLIISSIQFETIKLIVNPSIYKNKFVKINLSPKVVQLKEIYLKHLTGSLLSDIKTVPKDTSPKVNFSLKGVDLKAKPIENSYDLSKPPNAESFTNPIQMNGVGASARIPNFAYEKEKKQKALLQEKKEFPEKIVQLLGTTFFTKTLKIKQENIPNFLSYCEFRNIIELYNSNQYFEVIKILKEESISYNDIKK